MKHVLIKITIIVFLVCMPSSGTNSQTDSYPPILPEKSIPGIEHIEVTDNTLVIYSNTGATEIDKNTGLVAGTKPMAFSFNKYSYPTHYASTSSKPFLRNKSFNMAGNLLTKYEPFVFGKDFVCLIGEEMIGIYKGKVAWKHNKPNQYNRIDELSDSCIVFHGGTGMMVIEKTTGIVVLECAYPPASFSFTVGIDSNRTMSFIRDDQVAIIDNCFVVSIEGCPRLLWDLPIKGLPFILKDDVGTIQASFSKPDQATYFDKLTGEKKKEVVLAYEDMPNPLPLNNYGILGVVQNTAYGYMKTNPLSIFGFDIATGKILFSKPLFCQNQKHKIFDDGKSIFYVSPAGIEKIDSANGKSLWRSPFPDSMRFVNGPDDLYAFWPTYGKDGELENSISRFGSQEKALSSCPYIDYGFTPNLVPTKYGVVWVPQNGEGEGPVLTGADGTTKTYKLNKWSDYMHPGYACDGEILFVNYNGAFVSCIDLKTGNIDNIQVSETESTRKDAKKILLANDRWIFTDAGDYYWLAISRTDKSTKKFFKHKQSYSSALINEDCVVLSGTTVFGLKTYFQNTYPGNFLCFCEGGLLVQYNDGIVFIDSERGEFKKIATIKNHMGRSLKIGNILVSGEFMADIDKGEIVQEMLPYYSTTENSITTLNNKVIISKDGGYSIFSPCPSFSVKRTGKGGGNGKDGAGEVSFEFKNTREDGRDLVLKGEVYLVSWGDDGKAPLFAKLNEPRHKLGPLLPGMSQEISFKVPEPPLLENNQKGEGKYFALVVESNGLMDRDKSVLSEYDKDPRPLFDGTPVALDQQKAIVVTVWGR
ncbi:MAG TPA: hypothetical protein PLK43_06540 [Caldisericia bacterium]|nr:hypothetical protein [Caldisericia bacterium]HQL68772.1 hypothetical protein [Caldisericia bacterium]HUN19241.1 hypothetical protein [Caldisericia bacterium]